MARRGGYSASVIELTTLTAVMTQAGCAESPVLPRNDRSKTSSGADYILISCARQYDVVGVSLTGDGLAEYIATKNISYPVFVATDEAKVQYKMGDTPTTLIMAPDGRLTKTWRGAFQGNLLREVEDFFALSLPGLTPAAVPKATAAQTSGN